MTKNHLALIIANQPAIKLQQATENPSARHPMRKSLINQAQDWLQRLSETNTRLDNILIVTVTKVEAQAVLKVFSQAAGTKPTREFIGKKTYHNLGSHGGVPVFMVQSEMGIAGPGGALLTVRRAIQDLHPQAVIMCGIAFGLHPDKQHLGDILVAKQIQYYEPQKVDIERGQMPSGDRATSAERLLDRFRSGDLEWQGAPTHFGLVLSGEKLVNDPTFRDRFLKVEPEAVGGEMEGAGLYAAARADKVDWILVKAICDWADGEKNDDAHPLAASNAAEFVLYVLRLGGWRKTAPPPKPNQWGCTIAVGVIITLLVLGLAVTFTKNYELVASYLWPATPTFSPPVTDTPILPTTVSMTPPPSPSHTPTRPVKKTPIPTRTPTESPTSGPTPTPAPTATFAPVNVDSAALVRARAGVSTNGEWDPHMQEIDGVEMVLVPAGCFMMGDVDGESDENPVHEICFDNPFLIDRYEVTNAQFASFGGQAHQDSRWPDDNHPRERITWFEARTFCNVRGGRLPTEAEWEYAAAGPESWKFSWGNDFVTENAVHGGNSDTQTAPVGSKPGGVSWVGALDVIGNVWEWTHSINMAYPYDPEDGRESGAATGVERVARGGSWNQDYAIALRTANRFTTEPNRTFLDFGVRCVRDIGELP
ncbi:MAG: SUMF1/EgtB/PvdO family nonheme iron enzyme [Chloroflexi bacterium]|nr:SUMF1/EgtB/PvdO family nonheme iron enzyme [Chloroflexota bacterium]